MAFSNRVSELAEQDPNGVVGLKLSTGEFIIAAVSDNALGTKKVLKNPAGCGFSGDGKIGFGPWIPVGECSLDLDLIERHVLAVVTVSEELSNHYAEATGMKRILAPKVNKKIIV